MLSDSDTSASFKTLASSSDMLIGSTFWSSLALEVHFLYLNEEGSTEELILDPVNKARIEASEQRQEVAFIQYLS